MRVVRFAGENVSPSDDGRLYDQIFTNGLFEETTIAPAGGSQINIGPLYGIIRGRDFTAEAQTIDAILPTGSGTATGTIYAEIDISSEEPLSVKTALDPWTATNENINVSGVVAQVKIGTYTANPTAVTAAASYYENVIPAEKIADLMSRMTTAESNISSANGRINTAEGNISTLTTKTDTMYYWGFATNVTSPVQNQSFKKGDVFWFVQGDTRTLVTALTDIAPGTTLQYNVNIAQYTLGEAINNVNELLHGGIFALVDAMDESKNLQSIYNSQEIGTVAFINGQSENDSPFPGIIHLIISFKRSNNYGYMYAFSAQNVAFKAKQNGTWGAWVRYTWNAV